ncbi:MAG: methylmalonyl Co-A mutase-associated GTPase MeaB [bacterium]
MDDLIRKALQKDSLALGRLSRILDDSEEGCEHALRELYHLGGKAHIVGVTGPPGAGKSTLVSCIISEVRESGRTTAVLAVDPTSPYSGGAVLGDRIRMQRHATDPGVFIRSLATRGHIGGLCKSVRSLVVLLDAAGFDMIILETVGVGQEEVEIRGQAHTTIYVTVPGLGDGIQAMKAGILEIADIYLVNKADMKYTEATVKDLQNMLTMSENEKLWSPPVLTSVASEGEGVSELVTCVNDHWEHINKAGVLQEWRHWAAGQSVREVLRDAVGFGVRELMEERSEELSDDIEKVSKREVDPGSVARKWLRRVKFKI